MPRVIFKCPHIKPGTKKAAAHLNNYVRYAATREGVDKLAPEKSAQPATDKQRSMIDQLIRDFPLSRGMFEYEDYLTAPTFSSASEFISRAIEDNYDQIAKRENYVSYIAKRPRAERVGSHGLFNGTGDEIVLSKVADEVANHSGNVWLPIISLRRIEQKLYKFKEHLMELTFSTDFDSAKLLDDIMNSYPGRDRGSIMADKQSLTFMLLLLVHGQISVTEHTYPYDISIRDDSEMMETYSELARETRWKQFAHTEIEGIRINALRQMLQYGKLSYDGDYICYMDGQICVHCGNLSLPGLLLYFANHERVKQFYIFSYPYWTDDHTAKYYRLDLSESAVKGAQTYRNHVWGILSRAFDASGVIPEIPEQ